MYRRRGTAGAGEWYSAAPPSSDTHPEYPVQSRDPSRSRHSRRSPQSVDSAEALPVPCATPDSATCPAGRHLPVLHTSSSSARLSSHENPPPHYMGTQPPPLSVRQARSACL